MKYSQDALNEMAAKVDLLSYMERTVDFTKHSGNTYYCLCPFHDEDTPSLAVNEDEQYWHCFGCGKSGSIYTWIQLTEHLSFPQAVQKVAELTNSELHEYTESQTMSFFKELGKLQKSKTEIVNRTILDINKDYYQKYVDESPQEWIDEDITEEELKKYNIRIDPTSNRIVYPVFSNDDELISVKGRTRFKNYRDLKIMKYINYFKLGGRLDYFQGMQQARDSINASGEIIIVEGIKSVMKLDQWGFHNTVSAETSKLNEYQIELLIRMKVRDVVIAFDKDVQMKKIRECTELLKRFANVYVVYDKWGLLKDKDSPCDQGRKVWQTLYDKRIKL